MANAKVGLEITSTHVNLAVLSGGKIAAVLAKPLPDNLVKDDRIVSFEKLRDVIRGCIKEAGISAKDCALAIGERDIYTRRITMPAMTVDELELNLPFEFKDYISEEPNKYTFDYAMIDTKVGEDGKPVEFDILAAAVLTKTIEEYSTMLHQAGLNLKIAAPEIMAYTDLIPADATRDYCFLDIGTRNTVAHMFPNGRYEVSRPVEIGIESFVGAVANHYSVDRNVAYSYFVTNYEDAMTLPDCIELYEALAVEIARIVSFFNFNFPGSNLEVIDYCGGGASIEPLMEVLGEQLQVPLESVAAIMPVSNIPENLLERCVVPVGMALQGEGGDR